MLVTGTEADVFGNVVPVRPTASVPSGGDNSGGEYLRTSIAPRASADAPGNDVLLTGLSAIFQAQMDALTAFRTALDLTAQRLTEPIDKFVATMGVQTPSGMRSTSVPHAPATDAENPLTQDVKSRGIGQLSQFSLLESVQDDLNALPGEIGEAVADAISGTTPKGGKGGKPGKGRSAEVPAAPEGGSPSPRRGGGLPHSGLQTDFATPKPFSFNQIRHGSVSHDIFTKATSKLAALRTGVEWSPGLAEQNHLTQESLQGSSEWRAVQPEEAEATQQAPLARSLRGGHFYQNVSNPNVMAAATKKGVTMTRGVLQRDNARVAGHGGGSIMGKVVDTASQAGKLVEGGSSIPEALMGSLGGGSFAEAAGPIGMAAYAAYQAGMKGLHTYQDQRQQNAAYASSLGTSSSIGNMRDINARIGEKTYDLKNLGSMGSGQSSKIYKASYQALGGQSAMRKDYQAGANSLYNKFGVSTDESIKDLNTAVSSGVTNLADFTEKLKAVSEAAKDAGQNAGLARQMFMTNFQAMTQNTTPGTAMQLSSLATIANQHLPVGQQTDFSRLTAPNTNYLSAAALHMSVDKYTQGQIRGGAAAATQTAAAQDAMYKQFRDEYIPKDGQAKIAKLLQNKDVDGAAAAAEGYIHLQPEKLAERLAAMTGTAPMQAGSAYQNFVRRAFTIQGSLTAGVGEQYAGATGHQGKDTKGKVTNKAHHTDVLGEVTGGLEVVGAAGLYMAGGATGGLTTIGGIALGADGAHRIYADRGTKGTPEIKNLNQSQKDYLHNNFGTNVNNDTLGIRQTAGLKGSDRTSALLTNTMAAKGIVENSAAADFFTKYGNTDQKFLVTRNKKQYVLNAEEVARVDSEALMDDPGSIKLYGGPDDGKGLDEALGIPGFKSTSAKGYDKHRAIDVGKKKGGAYAQTTQQAAKDLAKEKKDAAKGGNVNVTIDLTDQAKSLITATQSPDPNQQGNPLPNVDQRNGSNLGNGG